MKKVRTTDLRGMKAAGQKIAVLTAYDAITARLFDSAGIDVLLVGDSLGMVVLGYETTLPVTMADMLHHTRAVARGASRALVVADMPFLSYQISVEEALRNAGRFIQEAGAAAVKIEGGRPVLDVVRRLVGIGIPVMGHLGLTPQSVHQLGGFRMQARNEEAARALLEDARVLEEAGVFSIVLESIPDRVAAEVTSALRVPTIGIGAGPFCDGQVLVGPDVLGLYDGNVPSFVKQYANLRETIVSAAREYAREVREGQFPRPRVESEPVAAAPAKEK
ncbi:MAG: 3-methyl-2-oxobutanoate hydroxymethyltransferase [Acidobacteriota bacterium]